MREASRWMLEVQEVDAAFGAVKVLHRVSLQVAVGEVVALIGANGAGKSTLMMAIFGMPRIHHGRILLAGEEVSRLPTHRIAQLGIALVPEGRRVFPGMTVEENLAMGLVATGKRADPAREAWIYELFPRLRERRRQRAGTLSGGEQQMLAIGRALMSRPRLLLLDEPSLGLAPLMVRQIFADLRRIIQEGTTVFLVEQNANQALRLADRGYVLVNGRVRLSGTGAELLDNPEVRRAYLGGG